MKIITACLVAILIFSGFCAGRSMHRSAKIRAEVAEITELEMKLSTHSEMQQ